MQLLRQIFATFLALLIVVSSTGFTLHKHYCLGELKSMSLNQETNTCMSDMEAEGESCPLECCERTVEELKLEEIQRVTFEQELTPPLKLVSLVLYVALPSTLLQEPYLKQFYRNYHPPLIDEDIPVRIQSFLI